MPEMWEDVGADDFALPGDDQRLQASQDAPAEGPTSPEPIQEPQDEVAENTEPEETAPERARNEKGQFVSQQPEAEPILGKFKSVEDLARSYQELERDRGRLANEVGQLRQQTQPQQPAPYMGVTQDQIEADPVGVANWALQNGHDQLYEQALDSMYESGDPALAKVATRFETARAHALVLAEVNELKQSYKQQDSERGLSDWVRQHPNLDALQPRMMELARENPTIAAVIQGGDPNATRLALDHLYTLAASEAGPRPENFANAVRQAAQDADREAAEAAVVSGQAATPDAPKPSAADKLGQQWADIEAVYDGWNI